jgi:type III secretion protein V
MPTPWGCVKGFLVTLITDFRFSLSLGGPISFSPSDLTKPTLDAEYCCSMAMDMPPSPRKDVPVLLRGDLRTFLGRYADVALAGLVVVIVAMMIVPLPTFLLDLLISLNIAVAVTLLLVSLYVSEPLKIATFPTLLLLTTLFRLALEVSATRLILLRGYAGQVIQAFGNFVVAGNLVVGAVVFVILTLIQYIVISKGSERVAEVGARFTLDAMPGKQMSIDAELRAGHIDHAEARKRRALLSRESQFFGAMDGAMKFVKGDAIAGMVVLLTNIVGGLVIGIVQRGMDAATAARTFTLLTIGEGLVAQIPALVISTAAGIIVTRVSSDDEGGQLGREVGAQILAQPKALAITAGLLGLLAIVPGLPTIPFLVLALLLGFVAFRLLGIGAPIAAADSPGKPAARPALPAPLLTPIMIELAPDLSDALLPGEHGRLLDQLVPALRERLFEETGLPMPAVRMRAHCPGLPRGGYVLRLSETPMARGEVVPGGGLALETRDHLAAQGIPATSAVHPDGRPAAWIAPGDLPGARLRGVATFGPDEVIAAHLLVLLRRHGFELLGIQETQALLEALERSQPALVREVVPKLLSPALLTDVLRRLAEEGVSLRALREILGALAEWAPLERDPVALTEHVRGALRRQLTARHLDAAGTVGVFLLDPLIEEAVREAIHKTATGSYLALEPELARDILAAASRALPPATTTPPVVLTSVDIRRHVRRLLETEHPQVAVLSYPELAPEARLAPLGRIKVQ